jgi:hypothetical protein
MGITMIVFGGIFCLTIIGAIIGLPMIMAGIGMAGFGAAAGGAAMIAGGTTAAVGSAAMVGGAAANVNSGERGAKPSAGKILGWIVLGFFAFGLLVSIVSAAAHS